MKLYLIKKQKGRVYRSEGIVSAISESDFGGGTLTHNADGAPMLDGSYISISDTKSYWCCLIADEPVGIDIEEKRVVKAVMARRLHAHEQTYLAGLEPEGSEWTGEMLSIWTRKEAYMKYCGAGLRMGLASFSVISEELEYKSLVSRGGVTEQSPEGFIRAVALPCRLWCSVCTKNAYPDIEIINFEYSGQAARTALERATDLLAQRMYSSNELNKKLIGLGYTEEEAGNAVKSLKEYKYLNDRDYAEAFVHRAISSGKGKGRIKQELRLKGISSEDAEEALTGGGGESGEDIPSERERAMEIAGKLPCGSDKEKARIARKLSALGYEPSVIYDVLGKLGK